MSINGYCESTLAGECRGWIPAGHNWHGCHLKPGHNQTGGRGKQVVHECKCGQTWPSRRRGWT